MPRKHAFVISIIALALIGSATTYAAPTPSAGAKCTKRNSVAANTSGIFKCTQNGKKLSWKLIRQAPKTDNKSVPPNQKPAINLLSNRIVGLQSQNLATKYVGATPKAGVIFRWPTQNPVYLGSPLIGYVIYYRSGKMTTPPPCDLTKGLCEEPKLVDNQTHNLIITDPNLLTYSFTDLEINTNYFFEIDALYGTTTNIPDELKKLEPPNVIYLVHTSGEVVPGAPDAIIG